MVNMLQKLVKIPKCRIWIADSEKDPDEEDSNKSDGDDSVSTSGNSEEGLEDSIKHRETKNGDDESAIAKGNSEEGFRETITGHQPVTRGRVL